MYHHSHIAMCFKQFLTVRGLSAPFQRRTRPSKREVNSKRSLREYSIRRIVLLISPADTGSTSDQKRGSGLPASAGLYVTRRISLGSTRNSLMPGASSSCAFNHADHSLAATLTLRSALCELRPNTQQPGRSGTNAPVASAPTSMQTWTINTLGPSNVGASSRDSELRVQVFA